MCVISGVQADDDDDEDEDKSTHTHTPVEPHSPQELVGSSLFRDRHQEVLGRLAHVAGFAEFAQEVHNLGVRSRGEVEARGGGGVWVGNGTDLLKV